MGGTDLSVFVVLQPDTSVNCGTIDIGLVHGTVCLSTPQLSTLIILPRVKAGKSWFLRKKIRRPNFGNELHGSARRLPHRTE